MRVVCFANSQEGRPEIERGKLPSAEEEQSGFTGTGRECSKNESRSFHQEPNERSILTRVALASAITRLADLGKITQLGWSSEASGIPHLARKVGQILG